MVKVIFDTGPLISFADSCLIKVLKKLVEKTKMEVIIPESVEKEAVIKPLKIRRFELSAMRIKKGIDEKWIQVWKKTKELEEQMKEIEFVANRIFFADGEKIEILHAGESETIALANLLGSSLVVMDERTSRFLLEDPNALKKFMSYKYAKKIEIDSKRLEEFKALLAQINVIRSTELVALAFEKGFFKEEVSQDKKALEAALYAVKYNGCAASLDEIHDYLKTK